MTQAVDLNAPASSVSSTTSVQVEELISRLFTASDAIRYVAFYLNGEVTGHQRDGLSCASSAQSDYYEEVLVNPTLLTLASQRGNLDCGGLRFIIVAYGNFYQLVSSFRDGHVSISLENSADPVAQQAIVWSILNPKSVEVEGK